MNKSENIAELAAALAKAQGAMESAKRDSKNPYFKSTYADLASVWDACRKPLSTNGLAVTQLVSAREDGAQILETVLLHVSGEWLSSVLVLTPKEDSPQAIGSAITYARRYALSAVVGVAADTDDDAESAEGRGQIETQSNPWQKPPAKPDTTSHYCEKHKTNWFMRGKMKSYAHPVGDGEWCYEPKPTTAQAEQAVKVARPEVSPAGADLTSSPVPPSPTPAPVYSSPAPGALPPWPEQMPAWKSWADFQAFYKSYRIDGSLIMQTAGAMFPGRTFEKTSDFRSFAEGWKVLQEIAILRGLNIGPQVDPEHDL